MLDFNPTGGSAEVGLTQGRVKQLRKRCINPLPTGNISLQNTGLCVCLISQSFFTCEPWMNIKRPIVSYASV